MISNNMNWLRGVSLIIFFITTSSVGKGQKQLFNTNEEKVVGNILTHDLKAPWSMAELPDNRLLITEKAGNLLIFNTLTADSIKIKSPSLQADLGQGSLLSVILHPDFANNQKIYLSYTRGSRGLFNLTIAMAELVNDELANFKVIFEALPAKSSVTNFGSGLAFDKQGLLYFGVGDRNYPSSAQDLTSPLGKIMRIKDDGKTPMDNPFNRGSNYIEQIYSYGHRNPQGLYFDDKTNQLWSSEHGPKGGDEINLIKKGKNYAWPLASFGRKYSGELINHGLTSYPGTIEPLWHWAPSIDPAELVIYHGEQFPNWQGDILVASLKFSYIAKLKIENGKLGKEEKLFKNQYPRIRDILVTQNGEIYLITDYGMLVKLKAPAKR